MEKNRKKHVVIAVIAMLVVGSVFGLKVLKSSASEGKGIIEQIDGVLYYTVDGEIMEDFTDAVEYQGTIYCVKDGMVPYDYTGLFNTQSMGTIYVVNGIMQKNYTGLASNHNGTFLVENGKVPLGKDGVHGLKEVNGEIYYFSGSKVTYSFTGITRLNTTRYYVLKGEICRRYTGVYTYRNENFYIEKGVVNEKRSKVLDAAIECKGKNCRNEDLTAKAYSKIGLELPSKNWDKINSKDNKKVDRNSMKPGDMLWYGRTANYQELGIYIGNDKMIRTFGSDDTADVVNIKDDVNYNGGNVVSWINE